MKQVWLYVVGTLIGLVGLYLLQRPDGRLHIVACDVGQGDAFLITQGYGQVLIDGGPSSARVLACLRDNVPFWDRNLEAVVFTNSDFDHINGLVEVIDRYGVSQVLTADGLENSETLLEFIEVVRERDVVVTGVEAGDMVRVGDGEEVVSLEVVWPIETDEQVVSVFADNLTREEQLRILGTSASRDDVNARSVVIRLSYMGKTALFTGDIGNGEEHELVSRGLVGDIDLLKVGHHGSKYSTSMEFLEAVDAEEAVISVGVGNRYGHPTDEVLKRLQDAGVHVRRTDVEGEIEIVW